jgi:radical SAM protein with 4Fe4S-binding SPASM domain
MKKADKHLNAIGAGVSYLASTITHKPYLSGMPLSAGIEITNYCNLKCPECSSGSDIMTRPRGFMNLLLFKKFISEAGPYLYNINLFFQGEPMLHPEFFTFIDFAGKARITVSTNGHFLTPGNCVKLAGSGISKLIVSLDGMSNDTYSKYRVGGDLEKVMTGIKNVSDELKKQKSSLKLEIQFLVNSFNESEISAVKQFAGGVNASLKLKSMQVINPDEIGQWMPGIEKLRRYRKDQNGRFVIRNSLDNRCLRLWMNPVITWDGKVVPCCFDKDAEYVMGNLNENRMIEIWQGEKYKSFRSLVLKDRKNIEICRNCTSGLTGVRV